MTKKAAKSELDETATKVAALQANIKLMNKYSENINLFSFFVSGFLNSCKFKHLDNHYHGKVNVNYFDDVVWDNVGRYLYKGMDDIEHEEKSVKGVKAKFQQQTH